ncbi:sulfatase [Brachybacterium endophyticum]|uniref:Sulfatase n=1 Tax=Brachybacterium endophyticum TaxID=2182385 RepID=A0A2U2RN72_9MICO|nr:sulfatase [Brachybacterium endophyticum]PWH07245.1 sulfatase [Brachybacterium endophyticum]
MPSPTRPNIVFVLSDDHAAHAISAYGSRVNTTPQLDRLADEGARLDAMYCTNSICTPSRASLLTGTYSHVNGASTIYTEFDHRVPTLSEALQGAGYATALFGKWHLGESAGALPRGFDEWRIFPGQGDYWEPRMIGPEGEETREGYASDLVTDMALEWLESSREQRPEDPFCLMLHHKAPHRPWIPHPRHADLYPAGSIPEPETLLEDLSGRSRAVQGVKMSIADDLTRTDIKEDVPSALLGEEHREERARWTYQRYMRDYLQTIQAVDDSMGRVLDHLEAQGLTENTLVVYASDQGFFLGDHGLFDKRLMYDESLQMPMMIRWPARIPAGSRVTSMLANVDVAATLLDAAGLDPDAALPGQQGRSFLPLLRGEEIADWPRAVYYRYWEHDDPEHHAPAHYGIRTERWKYIDYYGAGLEAPGASDRIFPREYELYDLREDPRELRNLAEDPAYAGVRADLAEQLAQLQASVGDRPYTGPGSWHPDWNHHAATHGVNDQERRPTGD